MHSLTNWPFISFQIKISIVGCHICIPPTRYPDPVWNGEVWILVSVSGCDLSTSNVRLIYYSVQFSRSLVSDSLRPHESQHARPPFPSPTPRVHSDSCPSSRWCHPAILSSVVPFSSCPQSLPASESLPMSQLFAWGGQSIEVSALASFLPKKSQGWSPSEWTGWISLQSKGLSRVFSNTTVQKHQFFGAQLYYCTSVNLDFSREKHINKRITRGSKIRNQNHDK